MASPQSMSQAGKVQEIQTSISDILILEAGLGHDRDLILS